MCTDLNMIKYRPKQHISPSQFINIFMKFASLLSPIWTVIVSQGDVCKNKFTYHLSDKTHGFGCQFIHSGGASSVILRTRESAAHMTSHMIVCCK